jgi:hypothetical protein
MELAGDLLRVGHRKRTPLPDSTPVSPTWPPDSA